MKTVTVFEKMLSDGETTVQCGSFAIGFIEH